jgi:Cu+-exporting ATPase
LIEVKVSWDSLRQEKKPTSSSRENRMREMASPFGAGILAITALLGIYFSVLTAVSGWSFTVSQFKEFWPYIGALAVGFGWQVGLFFHLKRLSAAHHHSGHVMAVSGTTSSAAMLACCTHYLANILPVVGAVGVISLIAQYQIALFWIGLAFNLAGLVYIGRQVWVAKRAFTKSHAC